MFKAKIALVGPSESGKSTLSNFLTELVDYTQSEYHPTAGARILEFDEQVSHNQREVEVEVELWDCGGSDELEDCWPAMASDADGVIIVYNPFSSNSKSQLEKWYNYFIHGQGLKNDYCALFAHCHNKNATKDISSPLPNMPFHITNLDGDPDGVRDSFRQVLKKILGKLSDSREKEELSIIN